MRALVLLALLALAGCGLDRDGLGPVPAEDASEGDADASGSGPFDATHPEGAPDVETGFDAPADSCAAHLPSGWSLVYYETTLSDCPDQYLNEDGYTDPQAMPGACTCNCDNSNVTGQPTCTVGKLTGSTGPMTSGPGCNMPFPSITIPGPGCVSLDSMVPLPKAASYNPIGLTGGTCAGVAQGNTGQVTQNVARLCEIPPDATEAACSSAPPANFETCLVAPNDVDCPGGTPFQTKVVMASSNTLVCSVCSSCTVTGSCASTFVELFTDAACTTTPPTEFIADGVCNTPVSGPSPAMVAALEYSAAPTNVSCTASGSTPSFQSAGVETICCR